MNYQDFVKIRQLVEEREQLKKGLTLIREMAVKSATFEHYQAKLVFTETVHNEFAQYAGQPIPSIWEAIFPMHPALKPHKESRERGTVMLDEMVLLKVSAAISDYWEERIQEINQSIKALGLDP